MEGRGLDIPTAPATGTDAPGGVIEGPHLRPIRAGCWGRAGDRVPTAGLDELRGAADAEDAVWIEAALEGLDEEESDWYGGSFDIWESSDRRPVDWTMMECLLEPVGLDAPTKQEDRNEAAETRLLRALPCVLSRGVFGTIRDISDLEETLSRSGRDSLLTVFPTVGFHPQAKKDRGSEQQEPKYTVIRTIVGVVGQVVITLRLPDLLCPKPSNGTGRFRQSADPLEVLEQAPSNPVGPLDIPNRYFPLRRKPSAREVAEGIGIHQAATVRGVVNLIDVELMGAERRVRKLRDVGHRQTGVQRRYQRQEVGEAARSVNRMAEITHELDQRISRLLRRFGGKAQDAPEATAVLVPREVRRGYRYALDDVKSLQEKCRITGEAATDALESYDKEKRERFQLTAAVLASIVLIPTLLASLFGVNFGVPAEKEETGFWVFLIVMLAWIGIAYRALKRAQAQDWYLSGSELGKYGILALIIAIVVVVPAVLAF
jgi:hypothetical protein